MSLDIKWSVKNMVVLPNLNGHVDYVYQVNWVCEAFNPALKASEKELIGTSQNGATFDPLLRSTGDGYTPYDELTEEQVIGWVKTALGPSSVLWHERNAVTQFQAKLALAEAVQKPLPWEKN